MKAAAAAAAAAAAVSAADRKVRDASLEERGEGGEPHIRVQMLRGLDRQALYRKLDECIEREDYESGALVKVQIDALDSSPDTHRPIPPPSSDTW